MAEQEITAHLDDRVQETVDVWMAYSEALQAWTPKESLDEPDNSPEYLALKELDVRAEKLAWSLNPEEREAVADRLAEINNNTLYDTWLKINEEPLQKLENDPISGLDESIDNEVRETIEQDPVQDIVEQDPEATIDQSLDRDARDALAAWDTVNQLDENLEIHKMEADLLKYEADSRQAVVDKGPEYSNDAKVLINTNERIKELEQQVKELREPTGNFLKDLSNEIKANHITNTELTRLQQSRNEMTLPGDGKSPNYRPNLKGEIQKADMEFKKVELELVKAKLALDKKTDRIEQLSETREANLEQAKEKFNKLDQKQQQAVADRIASKDNNLFRQNMPEQAQQADLRAEQSQSQAAEQGISQQASQIQEMAPMRER